MTTWNAETPAELPPVALTHRLIGGVRVAALVALTALVLGVFLTGRALRHWLGRWVGFHFLAARLWARAGLWILGLRHVVRGRPVASGALVANHCSWLDILSLRAVRLIYFVSKAEVADWPVIGFITRITGTVFIERRRGEAKRQEELLLERIAARQVLAFFPEGTSTDGLRVLPFKSSLFSAFFHDDHPADLLVQPVTVRYRPNPRSGLPASFYGWWGDMGFEAHIWQVACRSHGAIAEVIFHEPVRPRDFPNRKTLAVYCHRKVAEGHAAPLSA